MSKYIYGLDISLKNTGIAIFSVQGDLIYKNSITTVVNKKTGLINIPNIKNKEYETGLRLNVIYQELKRLKTLYPPEKVIIERGFSRFHTATQNLFRVHGIVNLLFCNVPNIYYPPKQIKSVILSGTSEKKDLADVIMSKLDIAEFKDTDESDAVAIALTYLIENKIIDWSDENG